MGSLIKGLIGKEDLEIQYNTNDPETFERLGSTGGTIELKKFPDIWDGKGKINVAEVNITGASSSAPLAHNVSHENSGYDEISVVGLSGLLADDQHVLDAEVLAIAATTNHLQSTDMGGTGTSIYHGYAKASLPTPGALHNIARVTDNIRGLWQDQGAQWFGLNGEMVNVKEFGAKGDDSTNDTTAIANAINAANSITGLNKPTLYFPAGTYKIQSNALPDIKCNVYGPDATICALNTETDTLSLLSVDYHNTIGQFFVLRAIHGAGYGVTGCYNCGLQVNGADNSIFRIAQLEALDTGISLAGNLTNYHIAQNTFHIQTCMTVNKGFNLTSGTGIQVEANSFHVEYLRPGIASGIGVYLSNDNNYTSNNIFKINVMELHVTAGEVGFYLTGTTPAKILQNVFEVSGNLTSPTGTGKILHCDANIGKNIFKLCNGDYSLFTISSEQLIQLSGEWTYGKPVLWGSIAPNAGYWPVGSICWNMGVAAGGSPGWVCTTAGTPGTWKAMAVLAA